MMENETKAIIMFFFFYCYDHEDLHIDRYGLSYP